VAQPLGQRRHALARRLVAAGEQHRRGRARRRGGRQLLLEPLVADAEDGQVDRLGQLGDARVAGEAEHLAVVRVDRVDGAAELAW
jgi:hypothetical protein